MEMKRILMALTVVMFLGNGETFAQNTKDDIQNKKADKTEWMNRHCQRMAAQLSLDDATTTKFTPIYKDYLQEVRSCHKRKAACSTKSDCTDAERLNCIENHFDNRQKMLDIQEKYYNKLKKVLNARQLQTIFCHPKHHVDKHYKGHKGCYGNYGKRHHSKCTTSSYRHHCNK